MLNWTCPELHVHRHSAGGRQPAHPWPLSPPAEGKGCQLPPPLHSDQPVCSSLPFKHHLVPISRKLYSFLQFVSPLFTGSLLPRSNVLNKPPQRGMFGFFFFSFPTWFVCILICDERLLAVFVLKSTNESKAPPTWLNSIWNSDIHQSLWDLSKPETLSLLLSYSSLNIERSN